MGRIKDDEKRQRILAAAKHIFAKPGCEEATLKELARQSEMTASGIYTYFSDKQEIITEIIERAWAWMNGEVEKDRAQDESGWKLPLHHFYRMYMPELLADRDLAALIVQNPQAIPDIQGKMEGFAKLVGPGLDAFRRTYKAPALTPQVRTVQSTIIVLGCLCSIYFAENSQLDFTENDILWAFRSFLVNPIAPSNKLRPEDIPEPEQLAE